MKYFVSINDDDKDNLQFSNDEMPEIYKKHFDEFNALYRIQNVKSDRREFHDKYIIVTERTCIFCGLSHNDTKFRSKAHLMPRCLGNKQLLSFRECDECNNHFSAYENDITNFLGYKNVRENSKRKYKPPSNKFILTNGENGLSLNPSIGEKIKVLIEDNHMQLPFRTHSYSILNIWKLMVKIALSCMDDDDLINYEGLIRYLFKDCGYMHETHYKELYSIYIHEIKGWLHTPIAVLYKKRDNKTSALTHTFQLYFGDQIWQIFLPMNLKDEYLYDGTKSIRNYYCPPMLLSSDGFDKINTPTIKHIYGNRKAKTHRIQYVKIPLGILPNLPKEFILMKRDKQINKHFYNTRRVKYTRPQQ